MRLEGEEISLLNFNIQKVENQSVLKVNDFVLVLNDTSTKILEFIVNKNFHNDDVSYQDIVRFINQKFDVGEYSMNEILDDIKKIISEFKTLGLIVYSQKNLGD